MLKECIKTLYWQEYLQPPIEIQHETRELGRECHFEKTVSFLAGNHFSVWILYKGLFSNDTTVEYTIKGNIFLFRLQKGDFFIFLSSILDCNNRLDNGDVVGTECLCQTKAILSVSYISLSTAGDASQLASISDFLSLSLSLCSSFFRCQFQFKTRRFFDDDGVN